MTGYQEGIKYGWFITRRVIFLIYPWVSREFIWAKYTHMHTFAHMYTYMCICNICSYAHICMYVYAQIYAHTCIDTHIFVYIYIYIAMQCVRKLYKNLKNGCCTHILNFWSFIYWSYSLRNHICIQYTLSCQPLTPPRVYPPTPPATSCPFLGPTESNQSFPYAQG